MFASRGGLATITGVATRMKNGSGGEGGRPGRRRKTDEKIAAAVMDLLREKGPDAVTMDAVTAASGVAKTTLYRRYADRDEMLAGVAKSVSGTDGHPGIDIGAEASLDGFEKLIRSLRDLFTGQVGTTFVGNLLTGSDGFLAIWRERLVEPQMAEFASYFDRGVAAGVFRPDVDYGRIIEFILGGLVVGDALHGGLDEDWSRRTASALWPAIAVS